MQAPSLRYFSLDNRLLDEEETGKFLTSIDFANFLESVPSITHLELLIGWRSVIDEGIFHRIILRPNLEMLSLGQDIPLRWETIARIANELPQTRLFPALRYLDIAAEDKVLRFLLPKLVNLQGVSLNQTNPSLHPGDHVLGTLSSCSRMEDIVFESDHTTVITNTFLKLAANCPELRKFELGDTCQCDHGFTDGLLETLASRWKYLTTLNFPFAAKLSIGSLVSLARHCPRLYDVKLMADLELHDLAHESTDITFPCLDALELGHITTSMLQSDRDAMKCRDQISGLLDDRFPLLYTFRFTPRTDNEHSRILQRAMNHHFRTTRSAAVDLRPTPVVSKLTRRLIEPIAGSRYNPTF
ncbi:hypothetical protein NUU61_004680 [Penicillium alfredii]|uniref:F-box domain-containing protein n=1 Tax=Penicillium alfredii TaxID=1506179 RepID=A0A9W9K6W6_9EURO|nr:uncharacterized protein NUU61_004680 [Penicillium alfredii]KAJ5095324.1 hypothetical protein NUU61_004680 [Penicillium alfredii]